LNAEKTPQETPAAAIKALEQFRYVGRETIVGNHFCEVAKKTF